jgi:hypothetical protein
VTIDQPQPAEPCTVAVVNHSKYGLIEIRWDDRTSDHVTVSREVMHQIVASLEHLGQEVPRLVDERAGLQFALSEVSELLATERSRAALDRIQLTDRTRQLAEADQLSATLGDDIAQLGDDIALLRRLLVRALDVAENGFMTLEVQAESLAEMRREAGL